MVNSIEIEYLQPKKEFRIGSMKNIAVPSNNKDDIKKMYPNEKKVESNADMLSQNFSTVPEITPIPKQDNIVEQNVVQPNTVNPIMPSINSDLEKTPVDLSINNTNVSELSIPQQNVVPEIKPIDLSVTNAANQDVTLDQSVIPEIKPLEIDSAHNLGVQQNTFSDLNMMESANNIPVDSITPIPNTADVEENKPLIQSDFNVGTGTNYFDIPENNPMIFNNPTASSQENVVSKEVNATDIKSDMIEAEIAILESDIKHYEGLAENNRKKIELLKKQVKKEVKDINLENTASDLFNNSGALDEEKVLGKTPMPNLRVA